jgi:predicted Holliday junction resolvase-like endonuclease
MSWWKKVLYVLLFVLLAGAGIAVYLWRYRKSMEHRMELRGELRRLRGNWTEATNSTRTKTEEDRAKVDEFYEPRIHEAREKLIEAETAAKADSIQATVDAWNRRILREQT